MCWWSSFLSHLCVFCSSQYLVLSSSSISSSLYSRAPLTGITRAPGSWASTHSLIFTNLRRTGAPNFSDTLQQKLTGLSVGLRRPTTCSFSWCNPSPTDWPGRSWAWMSRTGICSTPRSVERGHDINTGHNNKSVSLRFYLQLRRLVAKKKSAHKTTVSLGQ